MGSKAMVRKEVEEDKAEYADLYRDIRAQFIKGKPTKIELRHLHMRGGEAQDNGSISVWEGEHFEGLDPEQFTAELLSDALEDSNLYPVGSTQVYGVFVFRKGKGAHDKRITIQLGGGNEGGKGTGLMMSEGPDHEGRTSQIMRHDEAFGRLALSAVQHAMSSMEKKSQRDEAIIEKFMEQQIKGWEALQGIIDRSEERTIQNERTRKNYAYMDQGIEKVMELAPFLLAAKMKDKNPQMAQAIMQATANPAPQILKAFIADMEKSPDQAAKVFEALAQLPNGVAIIQALNQVAQMEKAANGSTSNGTKQ